MKVLFTVDALINAGTEKSILSVIPHFSSDIHVSVVYFYPRHDLKKEYEAAGIELHFMDLKGRYSWWQGVTGLKKLCREQKPDIIISSLFRANIISRITAYLTKTKLIGCFVNDSYSPLRIASFSLKKKLGFRFFYWIDRVTAGIPVAWISNSESIKQTNCRVLNVDEKKVTVIYRGRDTDKFRQWEDPLNNDLFVFTSIGRLLKNKGFVELIHAFAKLEKEFPQVRLNIYGEGPDRLLLEELITQLQLQDKIILHGNIPQAWQKLYTSNCFVFPSWYEGFSGALVEAMMTGIPIISSDSPMNLEAVTAEETALVHRVKNTEDLAANMKRMMMEYSNMKKTGAAARKEAMNRFDIKKIALQYENFLRSQVNRS